MSFSGELPKTLAILREACNASGVGFEVVDSYSGFVVRLTKAGQQALKRSHRLVLSVRVRFVPDGGDGRTETKTITFTRGGVR